MNRSRIALALLLLLLPTSTLWALEPDERLQFADGLYARDLHDLAAPEYQSFLKDFPKHAKADVCRYRLGECYRKLTRRTEAMAEFKRVYQNFPKSKYHINAGFKLGELLVAGGGHVDAIAQFKKLLTEKPPADIAAASRYMLGNSFSILKKPNDAELAFRQLTEMHPKSGFASAAFLALGNIAANKDGQATTAANYYQSAAKSPSSPRIGAEAWFQLAELHLRSRAYEKSADAYDKLFALYPRDERVADAQLQSVWALHNAGRYQNALVRATAATAKPAFANSDNAAEWLYLRANCERQLGQRKAASASYDQLIKKRDSRFSAAGTYEKALILHDLKDFRAVTRLLKSFTPPPNLQKDTLWLRAEAYAAIGDRKQAMRDFGELVKQFPASNLACRAMYRMGHLLQTAGSHAKASEQFLAVVKQHPRDSLAPRALFASAFSMTQMDKHAEAIRDWSRLIADYADSDLAEESLYQKAMSETRLKKDADALASLRSLLKRFPKTRFAADAHYWLGLLLAETDKNAEAEQNFRSALALKLRTELRPTATLRLAMILRSDEKTDEAAGLFESLMPQSSGIELSPATLEWLSTYRHDTGKAAQALSAAQQLATTASTPRWKQVGWCLVGRSHLGSGKTREAAKAFAKSLGTGATTRYGAEAALRLGQSSYTADKFKNAIGYYEQAARIAAGDELISLRANAYVGIAKTYKAQDNLEDAAKYFMSVAILFDDPLLVPECLHEAAQAFNALGQDQARQRARKELAQRYPDSKWNKEQ